MELITDLKRISTEKLDHYELFKIAQRWLKEDYLPSHVRKFMNDIRDSTKHVVILGCGTDLDYSLLKEDAELIIGEIERKENADQVS